MRRFFRDIRIGVRNLFVYFPLIWRTREWDYAYLLELMAFKMRRMAWHHREQGYDSGEEVVSDLEVAANMCEHIQKEDFLHHPALPTREWNDDDTQRALDHLTLLMQDRLLTWWD